ncbi:MAG TPA: hypothetical protein PK402_09130, partial [Tepidisphaeraceae bacterium]|nr:hypothetical protein [Tepidisphaeraceae bacterium]
MLKRLLAAALILITTLQTRAADIDFDATGQARAIVEWPGALPFSSSVWIVRDGWQTILQQSNLQNVKRENKTITGTFETADGSIAFEQSTRDLPKATRIDY